MLLGVKGGLGPHEPCLPFPFQTSATLSSRWCCVAAVLDSSMLARVVDSGGRISNFKARCAGAPCAICSNDFNRWVSISDPFKISPAECNPTPSTVSNALVSGVRLGSAGQISDDDIEQILALDSCLPHLLPEELEPCLLPA